MGFPTLRSKVPNISIKKKIRPRVRDNSRKINDRTVEVEVSMMGTWSEDRVPGRGCTESLRLFLVSTG